VNEHQKIRLLLADVDGTLVTQDKLLTDATRAAAVELHEAGLMLAITSGISRSQFPGRNYHPGNPVRSCSRTMYLGARSVRSSSSVERAWSAPSPEVVGGWMTLSRVE
jgi:phosphoglycolate phosphatase-like HAD superfamily hydrolase